MSKQAPAEQPSQDNELFFDFVHELRGPLNVVTVYAELLQTESGALNEKQKHYTELIVTGAQTLEREIETYLERLQLLQGNR